MLATFLAQRLTLIMIRCSLHSNIKILLRWLVLILWCIYFGLFAPLIVEVLLDVTTFLEGRHTQMTLHLIITEQMGTTLLAQSSIQMCCSQRSEIDRDTHKSERREWRCFTPNAGRYKCLFRPCVRLSTCTKRPNWPSSFHSWSSWQCHERYRNSYELFSPLAHRHQIFRRSCRSPELRGSKERRSTNSID